MSNTTTKGMITVAAAALVFATMGCNTSDSDPAPTPTPQNPGQTAPDKVAYPDVPTGFDEGAIIPDLEFIGYANFLDPSNEGVQIVKLSDFYNPTGDGVFPAGSPYGANQPKPKALNLIISSVWCGPCNYEADSVLPGEYAHYKPMGGHFLSILIDSQTPGDPATFNNLTNWADKYDVDYSIVLDPASKVMKWYEPAFPGNMIVRTKDMKIIRVVAGVPNDSFWNVFDQVLNDTYPG